MSSFDDRSTFSLVWQILERKDKWRLSFALVLILIGTVLEMASLGLVIPVVQAVVEGDQRSSYSRLPSVLEEISYSAFVQILMVLLVIVFVVKNLFLLCSNYFQQRLQLSISNRVFHRLFELYLRQPYEFHLAHSSSLLVRNVQEYSTAIVGNGVTPILTISTDAVTGLGLLIILLLVEPLATGALLVLFAFSSYFLLALSRSKTRRWGAERVIHRGRILEAVMNGFGGVKEIKVFGRDEEILGAHRDSLYQAARSSYLFAVAQGVPRAIFEVTAVFAVSLLVINATLRTSDLQSAALIVALYGVVAFRMLPSVNRVIQSAQLLSFGRAGIEGAVSGLSLSSAKPLLSGKTSREAFRICKVQGLKFRYPNTETFVTDIDKLEICAGEALGIIGASGSGKSTLVDLLIGVLTPTEGSISINDRGIHEDPRFWQDQIGFVPQYVYLMDTTIRRNIAFGLPDSAVNEMEVERVLRLANLWDFVQTLPAGLETVVGERGVRLSGGQRQRLGIARALYGNPQVIVLDEATSALDEATEREIVESMREISRDRTLIVVAHRVSTLAHCSRLIRLDTGRVVQDGSYDAVIERANIE